MAVPVPDPGEPSGLTVGTSSRPTAPNANAAPVEKLSPDALINASVASADNATLSPIPPRPKYSASFPATFEPCCAQVESVRLKTSAPPSGRKPGTPNSAVLPSADSATLQPNPVPSGTSVPMSARPCTAQTVPCRAREYPRGARVQALVGSADQGGISV